MCGCDRRSRVGLKGKVSVSSKRMAASCLSGGLLAEWIGPFTAQHHAAFVADHWQKRPLLVRGFLDASTVATFCPLSKDGLIGLACDSSALPSRIVREHGGARPWECRRGPFRAADFAALPDDGPPWTL
jgi:ribosomal protein L16 Arg81 hydroxylase